MFLVWQVDDNDVAYMFHFQETIHFQLAKVVHLVCRNSVVCTLDNLLSGYGVHESPCLVAALVLTWISMLSILKLVLWIKSGNLDHDICI